MNAMDNLKRVSFKSKQSWELGGESVIYCEVIPNPPQSGKEALVRITHTNVYCPVKDVAFFIRVGNLSKPTPFDDLETATDWVKTELVEEIVFVADEEIHRSKANEPFGPEEEAPWDGTFEAMLTFPTGKNSIEIKVSSSGPIQSGVISDWVLDVN